MNESCPDLHKSQCICLGINAFLDLFSCKTKSCFVKNGLVDDCPPLHFSLSRVGNILPPTNLGIFLTPPRPLTGPITLPTPAHDLDVG